MWRVMRPETGTGTVSTAQTHHRPPAFRELSQEEEAFGICTERAAFRSTVRLSAARFLRSRVVRHGLAVTLVALSTAVPVSATIAGDLDTAIGLVLKMNEAAAQSQKKVSSLDDDTADLLSEYRAVQQQILSLKQYNDQIQKLVDGQDEQAGKLQTQIDEATMVGRGVTPMMVKMVDSLAKFVELDVPFLAKERQERVMQLQKLLNRPDVTEAERYRRITEAFQIENEYGRTIEAYRGQLTSADGNERTVEFLRIGRTALIYRTIEGSEIGAWNQQTRQWEPLPSQYRSPIKRGFRIARKQAAPDLFHVPVPAPSEASR